MDDYTCPISMDLMVDPVLADDGHMYDLAFLLRWFATTTSATIKSPKTNEPMGKNYVRPWGFHKAYKDWAEASGHTAPVPAGPYGRGLTPAPAPAPAPVPVLVPVGMPGVYSVVYLNCTDRPYSSILRIPSSLSPTHFSTQMSLSARMQLFTQTQATSILRLNFPHLKISPRQNTLTVLKQMLEVCRGPLWTLETFGVTWPFPTTSLRVVLSVSEYVAVYGPCPSLEAVFGRFTLHMLKDMAVRNGAGHIVPRCTTKQKAVRCLTDHYTPLCVPRA